MGDILSKLQMVSEKIGVTETAHTIEEQVDLISESLDKIPASTNIAEALDDLSEVAQNINNEEVYVDKTITANGEYLPAQDEATAYSKVTVNVTPPARTDEYSIHIPSDIVLPDDKSRIYALSSPDGILDNRNVSNVGQKLARNSDGTGINNVIFFVCMPLIKFNYPNISSNADTVVYFTPHENYDGFYSYYYNMNKKYSESGDTITPGDGYVYKAVVNFSSGTVTITKTNYNSRTATIEDWEPS